MKSKIALALVGLAFVVSEAVAQVPAPIIVQAVVPSATVARVAVQPVAPPNDSSLKTLQEIKTANEAILAKQAGTLLQLEEMEKAADQIKIYTKRG
ncbi:MAG: hypothetical protein ACR2HH_14705 [Chthoniobacterales bacterium]